MRIRNLIISKDPELLTLLEGFGDEIMADFDREADPLAGLRRAATRSYPLVVVDAALPLMKAFELCRSLRRDIPHVRLLLCTSHDDEFGRVLGLECGADDAISRPLVPREVLARMRALLRRAVLGARPEPGHVIDRLRFGPTEVNLLLRRVTRQGDPAPRPLSAAEVAILRLLASRPGRVCTRDELTRALWGSSSDSLHRRLASRIGRLRVKLEPVQGRLSFIQTVAGTGYRIVEPEETVG